jgi:probable F420-dependent oxidoreductase
MKEATTMAIETGRIGVSTPGLVLQPGAFSPWETTASFEDVVAVVRAADRLGYSHVTCSEHIGVPADQALRRGARYYDPLATFGYFSAVTSRIRFATSVLVLGYHHPLEIAKRYGTLDAVSGGRVILGLGVGSLKEEFDLLGIGGAEFTERGARGDDALRALRAALGRREPEYHGRYYDFGGLVVDPCAVQTHLPLWIGGRSGRSLRRAVELGDGWVPFGLERTAMEAMIAHASETEAWAARQHPLEVVLSAGAAIDPLGDPERSAASLRALFKAGATKVSVHIRADSASHHIEQLERLPGLDVA